MVRTIISGFEAKNFGRIWTIVKKDELLQRTEFEIVLVFLLLFFL
ncbi:hypothetical protein SLEP1_g45452 [Rubroshorea leprosula]|uniref:Uncharacterized protein n=1 Tax=Rubroshorea leprosula TaxID=152421 RepID=A0AAV5LKU3_9ROSI|nr:hypothetical protein SLEP1_g45452 [Rubroshorea leprosula]